MNSHARAGLPIIQVVDARVGGTSNFLQLHSWYFRSPLPSHVAHPALYSYVRMGPHWEKSGYNDDKLSGSGERIDQDDAEDWARGLLGDGAGPVGSGCNFCRSRWHTRGAWYPFRSMRVTWTDPGTEPETLYYKVGDIDDDGEVWFDLLQDGSKTLVQAGLQWDALVKDSLRVDDFLWGLARYREVPAKEIAGIILCEMEHGHVLPRQFLWRKKLRTIVLAGSQKLQGIMSHRVAKQILHTLTMMAGRPGRSVRLRPPVGGFKVKPGTFAKCNRLSKVLQSLRTRRPGYDTQLFPVTQSKP